MGGGAEMDSPQLGQTAAVSGMGLPQLRQLAIVVFPFLVTSMYFLSQ